ncbi:hypothetical protein HanRHA438_Chr10g0438411 [Helianthus annuus]|nr:hypothetical protein HanRHA438_Chr10g0438411 [Helianthus annuus]KAJ0882571.1 hypothetical protein HanPSC8_Chr10g0411181 [Helianthus annuus]
MSVVRTGCFEFSSALGQFCSNNIDIFSARCSGESVGISSSFNGVLYPFFSNGFIQNQNSFDTNEAEAHPLTFNDFSTS